MMASSDGLLSHIWPKRLFLAGGYENFPVEIRRGPNLGRFWFLNSVENSRDGNLRRDGATSCGEEKPLHSDEKKGAKCHKVSYTRIFPEIIKHINNIWSFTIAVYVTYFTRNSRKTTLAAQPTSTTRTMSVTTNVPAIMNCYLYPELHLASSIVVSFLLIFLQ